MLVGMRMAEINRIDPWSSDPGSEFWQFYVKIKKHAELAPVLLHRVPTIPEIDPVLALLEIRSRGVNPRVDHTKGCRRAPGFAPDGRALELSAAQSIGPSNGSGFAPEVGAPGRSAVCVADPRRTSGGPVAIDTGIQRKSFMASPGLLDENGTRYRDEQIRALAKHTLIRANIPEKRPYHIKHAMVSLLYKKRLPPEQIALFLRQKIDSFTFFNSHVSNDLRRLCSNAFVGEFKVIDFSIYMSELVS
jgi:hypothetical protein